MLSATRAVPTPGCYLTHNEPTALIVSRQGQRHDKEEIMAISIRIPTPLRKFTAGQDEVEVQASTVGEALEALVETHPDIKAKIMSDDGEVRRFVNIFANDEDIRFQDKLETELSQGDQVSIVPAIAGGRQ